MQEVMEYKDKKDFEREQKWRLPNGWRIVTLSDSPQRAGAARYATLGLGAFILKPKSHVFVVWEKDDA